MGRSGWLALGAVGGALAASLPPSLGVGVGVALIAGLATWLWAGPGAAARRGRMPAAAALLGVLVLTIRVGLHPTSPDLAALPEGTARWTGLVESLGSPHDGVLPLGVRLDRGGV